ncbi:MAG TPA: DUF3850 domain-containing protein [Candidatus Blautia faecipullorum]|nr:DUF3850 domain-containing protein [Candidatus Blautia faecipullorum]
MEYIQLTLDDYLKSKTEIRENLGGIVKSFVRIGWQLTRIDRSKAYEMDGYKNIAEFAKAEYDMNPTGVSRFMSVYETYSLDGDTPELKEQYKDFNFSQLTEMLQLEEKDRGIFRPETKREDIREFKAFARENENNPEELLNWKDAKTPEEKLKATILEFFREKEGLLNIIFSSEAYRSGDIRELAELVNPSGGTSYRKGTVFLMLYGPEDQIMVKIFGEEPWKITWEEFFSVMQAIFGEAAAGSRTYENFFGTEDKEDKEDKQEDPAATGAQAPDKEGGPEEEKPDQEAGVREGQIPGQDNIMNHPEYMPGIAPAQKTEEQKYNEEQSRIDRETKMKLEEMEDEEIMEHLPSDEGPKTHQIRMPSKYYDDVEAGIMSFWFTKGDFRVGETLNMMEFSEGRHTGRVIKAEITYILDDYTGLEEGFAIMAIRILDTM